VFSNSGEDLNIIATIVVLKDDYAIEEKLKGGDNQLKLTKCERVKLWQGHELSDYLWVYTGSEVYWDLFQDRLIRDTARDGFEVKTCLLCGPEYVQDMEDMRFWRYPFGCDELFSSDVSRDSPIMPDKHTGPKRLREYSPWERSVIADEQVDSANVWTCHRTADDRAFTARFIPKPEGKCLPRTSSTEIRDCLRNLRKLRSGELRGYARNLILHPDLLAGMLFKSLP
jgi:hypothetical protein